MVSKCANPDCSAAFRYLHEGRIFHLTPTPAVRTATRDRRTLHERFWLCEECVKTLTVVWDGARAKVMPKLAPRVKAAPLREAVDPIERSGRRTPSAGPRAVRRATPGSSAASR